MWKKWCDAVDKHNEKITYANYEDAWSYLTPLQPVVIALLLSLFFVLEMTIEYDLGIADIIPHFVKSFVIVFTLFSLALFINWKINE